jgi:hypothetical protein
MRPICPPSKASINYGPRTCLIPGHAGRYEPIEVARQGFATMMSDDGDAGGSWQDTLRTAVHIK